MNSLFNILSLGFLKDRQSISLIPSKIIRYTRKREIQLPPVDADAVLVDEVSPQTLRNKQLTLPKVNENAPLTATSTELNQLDGINLQAELDNKQQDVISARGDLVVGDVSGEPIRLTIGTDGQVLTSDGTTANWKALPTATISTPGVVLRRPLAHYGHNSTQTVVNATSTIVNFNIKSFDTHNAVTTGAGWKFTAPTSGYYSVSGYVSLSTGSAGFSGTFAEEFSLSVFKNGTRVLLSERYPFVNEAYPSISVTGLVYLAAGDYVDLRALQRTGGDLILITNTAYTYVSISMIEAA